MISARYIKARPQGHSLHGTGFGVDQMGLFKARKAWFQYE